MDRNARWFGRGFFGELGTLVEREKKARTFPTPTPTPTSLQTTKAVGGRTVGGRNCRRRIDGIHRSFLRDKADCTTACQTSRPHMVDLII